MRATTAGMKSRIGTWLILIAILAGAFPALFIGAPVTVLAADQVVTIDSTGRVGEHSALALDANGNPVMAYKDFTSRSLKIAHCSDPNCIGPISITTPDSDGNEMEFMSLVLDANGNPVVSYYVAFPYGDLRIMHCNDPNCAGGDESFSSPHTTNTTGRWTSLKLDSAGNPVVAFQNATDTDLMILHCNDPNCTGGGESVTTPNTNQADSGRMNSLQLDSNGNPVVAFCTFQVLTCNGVVILRCNDANCAGGDESIAVFPLAGMTNERGLSLALDSNDFPVAAWRWDGPGRGLLVLHCNDLYCQGDDESMQTPIGASGSGLGANLVLDANGNPAIAYRSIGVWILRCNDPNCAGGDDVPLRPVQGSGDGHYLSMVLDPAGFPVASWYHNSQATPQDLKLLHCDDPRCDGDVTVETSIFTVNKVYSPATNNTPVTVTLTCSGGTITNNPQQARPGVPAQFILNDVPQGGVDCTAQENPVPDGYTASGCTDAVHLDPLGNAQCTLTNTAIPSTDGAFTVNKVYSPANNTTPVAVTLDCPGATVENNPQNAAPGNPAVFDVSGIPQGGVSCTASENPVPDDYTASGCTIGVQLDPGGSAQCTLTNTWILAAGAFTVNKLYSPANSTTPVTVTLDCPGATVDNNPQSAAPGSPAEFDVSGIPPSGVSCTASESPVPAGYSVSGCTAPVQLGPNGAAQCTLTNTEVQSSDATYVVHKIYNPASITTPVSVRLICAAGTVTNSPQTAAPGAPATFNVTGLPQNGAGCLAFESPVPDGYAASGCTLQQILMPGGNVQCTLTNTQIPTTGMFTVHKQYPANPGGGGPSGPAPVPVSVTLNCPGATVANNPQTAFVGAPAVFNVTGIPQGGVRCTATENPVPAGWTPIGCTNPVRLNPGSTAQCTITNFPAASGSLELRLYLRPYTDPGRFDLQIDGITRAARAGHRGATGALDVPAGSHQIRGVASQGANPANYSFSITCFAGNQIVANANSSGPVTVTVSSGASVACTLIAQRIVTPPPPTTAERLVRADCSNINAVRFDESRWTGEVQYYFDGNGDLVLTVTLTDGLPLTAYRWALIDRYGGRCRAVRAQEFSGFHTDANGRGTFELRISASTVANTSRVALQLVAPAHVPVPNLAPLDVMMSTDIATP